MSQPGKAREGLAIDGEPNDNELSLTEYDKTRKMVPLVRGRSIVMNTKLLTTEMTCPICLDLLTTTMTTKECLHRFCSECISMALLRGNKECPTCRTKLVSKRSLRHDTNFDELIKRIWPDRHKYDEMLAVANQDGDDALTNIVSFVDEEEERIDAAPSVYDPFDKDAPTPPALLDQRRTTSPMEMEGGESGRKTPPWFTMGNIKKSELDLPEKKLYMQAQKAYLKLKSHRLRSHLAGMRRQVEGETTETYSKTSRDSSPPREPASKARKLNHAGKKMLCGAKSVASSADSARDSDSEHEPEKGAAVIEADLDKDDMEELEMMDPSLFTIKTSKAIKRRLKSKKLKKKAKKRKEAAIKAVSASLGQNSSTSLGQGTSASFGQSSSSSFGQGTSASFGQGTSASFGQGTSASFGQGTSVLMRTDANALLMPPPPLPHPPSSSIVSPLAPAEKKKRPAKRDRFDPRLNSLPPFPDNLEQFAELMPNGKGATWQTAVDLDQPTADEDLDEELVFDEDDVISVVSIDDMLYEMKGVAHEEELEKRCKELNGSVFADLSKEPPEDKDKYACEETRMHLRELNELRIGSLADIKMALEDSEQFELGEAVTWYTQQRDGEEFVYYEKSKQPLTRGRRRTTAVYDVDEEIERLGRRVTMKEIRDDMSNTETEHGTPATMSLASSPPSSHLTLSEVHEEEIKQEEKSAPAEAKQDDPVLPLPPASANSTTQNKERLHRWIGEVAPVKLEGELSSIDPLVRHSNEDDDVDDCESLPENYEIEIELRPAASLVQRMYLREVPREVCEIRFIRTQHDTTLAHVREYLFERWSADCANPKPWDPAFQAIRPEHFYVFNRKDRHCKLLFSHETLATVQSLTARDEHLVIYYDLYRALLTDKDTSLLELVVPLKYRTEAAQTSSRDSTGSSSSR